MYLYLSISIFIYVKIYPASALGQVSCRAQQFGGGDYTIIIDIQVYIVC